MSRARSRGAKDADRCAAADQRDGRASRPRRTSDLAELAPGPAADAAARPTPRAARLGRAQTRPRRRPGRARSLTEAGSTTLEGFRPQVLAALLAHLDAMPDEEIAELEAATETLGSLVDTLQRGVA